jgi:predicted ATPase
MFISKFQVTNYKSFRSSEQIKFTQGFNIIVGRNNAGKTALIEALSLQFTDKPHRSVQTVPTPLSNPDQYSRAYVTFGAEPVEAIEVFAQFRGVTIPIRNNEQWMHADRFYKYVAKAFEVCGMYKSGKISEPTMPEFGPIEGHNVVEVQYDPSTGKLGPAKQSAQNNLSQVAVKLLSTLRSRIYVFRAERLNVGECAVGVNPILASNAHNLAEVLHLLQSSNPARYSRFMKDVRTIFPDIHDISIVPVENNRVRINVWFVEPITERKDLTVALADCGTGVGQALAILYVVLNSDHPRIILIDEPQSFLHPGAIRKLFEILKRYPQHQYIVTTHSPTAVTAANPRTLVLLRRENLETIAESINVSETNELRTFLSDVGARLSDVFGADSILWVEGRTEEICFQLIVEKVLKMELLGTDIIGVKQVGDLEGRHAKTVLEIYKRLCEGKGLLPPAIGFCFDQEGRSESDRSNLSANSNGMIKFIPRRMYENYLLNPQGIADVLSKSDQQRSSPVTAQEVNDWIAKKGHAKPYLSGETSADWVRIVDAARLLNDLFNELSETRVCFDKTNHGVKLTEWVIQNAPSDLQELADFLKTILAGHSEQA